MSDFSAADHEFMHRALSLAAHAAQTGEVPVGAVLVGAGGIILGEGANSPIATHDVSAHAEINALRTACRSQQNYRLPGTTLYVTLEPCAMCAGAIVHARVARVVIATKEPRAGAGGSIFNILNDERLNHQAQIEFGLLGQDSADLLTAFFRTRREISKANKQKLMSDCQ